MRDRTAVGSARSAVILGIGMVVMVCASAAAWASGSACDRIEIREAPGRDWCGQRFGDRTRGDRLREEADARIRAGDFEGARDALACAGEADDGGSWRGRYETVRRYGVLEYRRERIDAALAGFECALGIAQAHGDRPAIAKQAKNIGAALLRLGDYRGAQTSLEHSLKIQRADSNPEIGSALNNLADLYREQNDSETALRYYREALEAYRRNGDVLEAAHTLETMSVIALDQRDVKTATALLERALEDYRSEGHRPYRLRVYAGLVRAALTEGDTGAARRWSADGLALAAEHGLSVPAALHLQTARVERAEGSAMAAAERLGAALVALPANDPDRGALLEERGLALAEGGMYREAIALLRESAETQRRDAQARFDRQISWQRSRFEASERDRTITALAHENRRKSLTLWLVLATSLALALGAGVVLMRRRHRARIEEAARDARYQEALQRYRSETEALQIDRRLLKALLATHEEALCLLDADGRILTANLEACVLLGEDEMRLTGVALAERIVQPSHAAWLQALDNIEDSQRAALRLETIHGRCLVASVVQWQQDADILMLSLHETAETQALAVAGLHPGMIVPAEQPRLEDQAARTEIDADQSDNGLDHDARQEFRRNLVELMLAVVEQWESHTGSSRIELAERSRIWRIGIDDGRLRARTMERYLALSKLPENPRWRDVLRTVYFVFEHCPVEASYREKLQRRIYAVRAYTRRDALI